MTDTLHRRLATVDTRDIRTGREEFFRFRRRLPGEDRDGETSADRRLLDSVARSGVISPPIVMRCRGGAVPVSGFRRVSAAKACGIGTIDVIDVGRPDRSPGKVRVWLEEASFGEPASEAEIVTIAFRSLKAAGSRAGGEGAERTDLAPLLELLSNLLGRKITARVAARIASISQLGGDIPAAMHEGRISAGDILRLDDHPGIPTPEAAAMISSSSLSRAERGRAIGMMVMIADRGRDAWEEFAARRREAGRPLLESLLSSCYPSMERDIERADGLIRSMGLPPGTSVRLPREMEGGALETVIRARNGRGMRMALERLSAAMDRGTFSSLIEIIRGGGEQVERSGYT